MEKAALQLRVSGSNPGLWTAVRQEIAVYRVACLRRQWHKRPDLRQLLADSHAAYLADGHAGAEPGDEEPVLSAAMLAYLFPSCACWGG